MDGTLRIPSITGIDVELRIAGPGGRSYAFIVDWHIRVLLALAWLAVAAFAYFGGAQPLPGDVGSRADFMLIVVLPAAAIYVLYHPVLEVLMRGRTPGKRLAGVRIVRRDGAVPGIGPLLVRNLFRPIDSLPAFYCLGLVSTLFTRHAVRIGDIAAGTLLIYDDPAPAGGLAELSGRGIERLGLERAELVRDLLARWPELRPDVRVSLARQLLHGLGETPPGDDEPSLRRTLEALLK